MNQCSLIIKQINEFMWVLIGHEAIGEICDGLDELQRIAGVRKRVDTLRSLPPELLDSIDKEFGDEMQVG